MIDLIFVNNEHRFVADGVIPLTISDHSLIYCSLKVGAPKGTPRTIEYRSYKSYYRVSFVQDLKNIPWQLVADEDDINDAVSIWNALFLDVANNHAPIKKQRVNGINSPWMTSEISDLMRERDYYHRKARKSGSPDHWQSYKNSRNLVNKEIKASKSKYYINLIEESKGDSKKLWNAVNEASSRKCQSSNPTCIISDGVEYTNNKSIASILNKHFATIGQYLAEKLPAITPSYASSYYLSNGQHFNILPVDESFVIKHLKSLKASKATGLDKINIKLLKDASEIIAPSITKLINRSIQNHTFPSSWKCSKVFPLYKSRDRANATNYRPISVLPALSKLMEKAVYTQLYDYLTEHNILNDNQFGFRRKCSTTTALSSFADEILASMEKGEVCGAVFLDLSKAFDTVDHAVMLKKLSAIGVSTEDIAWFASYLSFRSLRTTCGPELSEPLRCNFGVPQGSILGPLLFLIYINEIPSFIKHAQLSLYADDTVLYYFSNTSQDLEEKLNADLRNVCVWLNENKLTLNTKKTKFMIIGSSRKLSNIDSVTVKVAGSNIERVEEFSYLGITFSTNMTWTEHVNQLCSKISKRLGLLKRIKHLLPRYARLLFYKSLILPLFDYGDLVWGDKNNDVLMGNLQILQNKAAKIILDYHPLSSSSAALDELGWNRLHQRRFYHRCLFIFKCLNGLSMSKLILKSLSELHSYNTRNKNNLCLPKVKRNWGKQRLEYHAVNDWNTLDEETRHSDSIAKFKMNYFKTH